MSKSEFAGGASVDGPKDSHRTIVLQHDIDLYAMDSVVNHTRLLLGYTTPDTDELRLAMTNVFVRSANKRVADGARRLLANKR